MWVLLIYYYWIIINRFNLVVKKNGKCLDRIKYKSINGFFKELDNLLFNLFFVDKLREYGVGNGNK